MSKTRRSSAAEWARTERKERLVELLGVSRSCVWGSQVEVMAWCLTPRDTAPLVLTASPGEPWGQQEQVWVL